MKEGPSFSERVVKTCFFNPVLLSVPEQLDWAKGVFSVVVDRTNPYWSLYILYHRYPKKIRNYFLYIPIRFFKQWGIFIVVGDFLCLLRSPYRSLQLTLLVYIPVPKRIQLLANLPEFRNFPSGSYIVVAGPKVLWVLWVRVSISYCRKGDPAPPTALAAPTTFSSCHVTISFHFIC